MPFVLCRFIGNASFLSSLMFSGWCFVALYLNEDVDYDESDVSLLSYFTSGITGDSSITSNFPFLRASFFTLFSFLFFKFFFITISYVFPFQIFSFLFFLPVSFLCFCSSISCNTFWWGSCMWHQLHRVLITRQILGLHLYIQLFKSILNQVLAL